MSAIPFAGSGLQGETIVDFEWAEAKLAGADLRGAEVSGLDLTALASRAGMKITLDQQYPLLTGLGIDVHVA